MSYAIRNDGLGWHAVNGANDCAADETFSESQPISTPQIIADANGFAQSVKLALGGIIGANALAVSYPLFNQAVQEQNWSDVQELIIDAKTKSVLSTSQYIAIKTAAANNNIPITL